jgi:catechol 2,3-dioxygenase-like lactoylglutathione lyase family enzyme
MDWRLEAVVVPVTDIDRAKQFYEQVGFHLDVDHRAGETFRVVQLTPVGSACSIILLQHFGTPGALQGLHLIVRDIDAARAELVARSVDVSDVFHFEDGAPAAGPGPSRSDYDSFLSFSDPDGNGWMIQEVPSRPS